MPFPSAIKNSMLAVINSAALTLKLFNGDPSASGTEVTGNGYSSKSGTFGAAATVSATVSARRLTADVDFGVATSGSWTQATHVGVYDGATLVAVIPLANGPLVTTTTSKIVLPAASATFQLRISDS